MGEVFEVYYWICVEGAGSNVGKIILDFIPTIGQERRELKADLSQILEKYWGDKIKVRFEDECPRCGQRMLTAMNWETRRCESRLCTNTKCNPEGKGTKDMDK